MPRTQKAKTPKTERVVLTGRFDKKGAERKQPAGASHALIRKTPKRKGW
jgi:hypothetical protein